MRTTLNSPRSPRHHDGRYVRKYANLFVIRSVTNSMECLAYASVTNSHGRTHRKASDSQAALEHQQPGKFRHVSRLQRHRIHREYEANHQEERTRFSKMLGSTGGFHVFPSQTDFLLVKILDKRITSLPLRRRWLKRNTHQRLLHFRGTRRQLLQSDSQIGQKYFRLVKTLTKVLDKVEWEATLLRIWSFQSRSCCVQAYSTTTTLICVAEDW